VWWHSVVLLTAGCNAIFPLRVQPSPEDATPDDASVVEDANRPLVPPDGATTCGAAPDFATWTFSSHPLPGAPNQMENPTFTGPDRVMFTSTGTLFETSLAGPPVEVTELALSDGSKIRFPGSTPTGDMIWFDRFSENATPSVGNYYALRSNRGWITARADFGVTAFQLIPSNVGFYSGTGRMIVSVEPSAGAGLRLVELETLDGLRWTQLDTLPFSTGAPPAFNASISADGCFVLFRSTLGLAVSQRDVQGIFQPPVALAGLESSFGPAINATNDRMWVMQNFMVVEGLP